MADVVRIIGIDPGLRNMGWGVIDVLGNSLKYVSSGTIKTDSKKAVALRLVDLYEGLKQVIEQTSPTEAAVEHTFVNKDAVDTLKLGQARSIALLVPTLYGLSVDEYAPNAVKKTVIGVGHGDKKQIQLMVKYLMPKSTPSSPDAADALAIAICHAHSRAGRKQAEKIKNLRVI